MTENISQKAGFTLMEMLVGLILTGMLVTALFSGLRFAAISWNKSSELSQLNQSIITFQNLLRNQLHDLPYVNDNPQLNRRISGTVQKLTILSRYPRHITHGEVNQFQYLITDSKITMTWRTLDQSSEFRETRTVLYGIDQAAFNFYGAGSNTPSPVWLQAWEQNIRLPVLIRLQVSFKSETSNNHWPEFIAQPRLNQAPPLYNLKQ